MALRNRVKGTQRGVEDGLRGCWVDGLVRELEKKEKVMMKMANPVAAATMA